MTGWLYQRHFHLGLNVSTTFSITHLLIAQWIEPHAIKERSQRPLHFLTVDELFIAERRVSGGKLETSVKDGVDIGGFQALRT